MNRSPNNEKTYKVHCKKLPQIFFADKEVAKQHFRKYGKIKRIVFKPKHAACTIDYLSQQSAEDLADNGYFYNNEEFEVTFENPKLKAKRIPKNEDPDWLPDSEVLEELRAMREIGTYHLRNKDEETPPRSSIKSSKSIEMKPKKLLPKLPLSITNDHLELIENVKKQAFTIVEKYNILDARDKLLRFFAKQTQSNKGATKGTCPDMCPEKERLLREIQHQISVYEQDRNKSLNPKLAVKQYSRSSADQEASLPHELRPVEVLRMTMSYLVHNIISLCDTTDINMGDWYHFLWDRTRSIRKDITQQELCCQGSVSLVEQCARFHIHCSARLIAEDPSVFDSKINTENLTKCLQTLKYMYGDLALKEEFCPNESEFRAYIILLNLNNSNFMWEVQKLRIEIQKSREVKHALEIYSALNNNNFVKFFKLVRSTPYLNACILLRYFTQVRVKALNILLKCYSPKITKRLYPISELTYILAFENDNYTIEFMTMCGLLMNQERTGVLLDAKMYNEPEFSTGLDRAINIVESKRQGMSVPQIISGSMTSDVIDHEPFNSFDSEGYLKLHEYFSGNNLNEIASSPKPLRKKVEPIEMKQDDRPKPQDKTDGKDTKIQTGSIFVQNQFTFVKPQEPIFVPIPEPQPPVFKVPTLPPKVKTFEAPKTKFENIFFKPFVPKAQEVPIIKKPDAREEELRAAIEAQKQKLKRLEEEKAERVRKEIERKRFEEEKIRELKRKERQKEIERRLEKERFEEIVNTVTEVVLNLIEHTVEVVRSEKLEELERRINRNKLEESFMRWRQHTIRIRRKRKALECNPLWVVAKSPEEIARELYMPHTLEILQNIKKYKLGRPININFEENVIIEKIRFDEITNILTHRYIELGMKFYRNIYWKGVIYLPDDNNLGVERINNCLSKFLGWNAKNNHVLLERVKINEVQDVTYCLERRIKNGKPDANGLIFISDRFNLDLAKHIRDSIKNYGSFVKLPIVLILQEKLNDLNKIQQMADEGLIADYLIITENFHERKLVQSVGKALNFLVKNADTPPELEMDTLHSIFIKNFKEIWLNIRSFSKWNNPYKECLKIPNAVIELYNMAVHKLQAIISNDKSYEYMDFPEIFKECLASSIPQALPCDYKYFPYFYKDSNYRIMLDNLLDSFKFPLIKNWPPENKFQLKEMVFEYCRIIFENPEKTSYRLLAEFLKNVEYTDDFKTIDQVFWIDIVEILFEEKVNDTDFSLGDTGFNKSIYNQYVAVYHPKDLENFAKQNWYYVGNPVIRKYLDVRKNSNVEDSYRNVFEKVRNVDIEETLLMAEGQISKSYERGEKYNLRDIYDMTDDLEKSLEVYKKISKRLSDKLRTEL